MRHILHETTNIKSKKTKTTKETSSDKEKVLNYIKDIYTTTEDFDLKYDLHKCIELLEGKENQEMFELKEALEDVCRENEKLLEEKTVLFMECERLREKNNSEGSGRSEISDCDESDGGEECEGEPIEDVQEEIKEKCIKEPIKEEPIEEIKEVTIEEINKEEIKEECEEELEKCKENIKEECVQEERPKEEYVQDPIEEIKEDIKEVKPKEEYVQDPIEEISKNEPMEEKENINKNDV